MRLMRTLPPAPLAADESAKEGARITREIVPACSAAAGTVRAETGCWKNSGFLKGTGFSPYVDRTKIIGVFGP
jgi:hypothetical protein